MSEDNQNESKFVKTRDVIDDAIVAAVEGVTGIADEYKMPVVQTLGRVLQRSRKIGLVSALKVEFDRYCEAGRIKDDYQYTEQAQVCLQELLDAIDNDQLDKQRFDALRKLFFVAYTETELDRESFLPQQYMQICRQLSSGDICILATSYSASKDNKGEKDCPNGATGWMSYIADNSWLKHTSLVESHETSLMEKHLISGRMNNNRSRVYWKNFRLTNLAVGLCEYMDKYDDIETKED